MKIALGIVALTLAVWSVYGLLVTRGLEEPEYTVKEVRDGYEIRVYPPHLVAETRVKAGDYWGGLNVGFRALAEYIFGNNSGDTTISMTAPVGEKGGEPIAMTLPVSESPAGDNRTVSFSMPKEYTLETIPKPKNPDVTLRMIPERTMAVMRFSWSTSAATVEKKKAELITRITADHHEPLGLPEAAFYNPPWTPPFLLRSEVMVEIQKPN